MKKYIVLVIVGALYFLLGCKSDPPSPPTTTIPPKKVDTLTKQEDKMTTSVLPTSHDCQVRGKMMEDNDFWIPKEQLWVCIVADDITRDQDFGDSYRIFDIYDTENCRQIKRKVLPVNNSPDYPWYLFPNTYEEKNQVICTSGFEFTFCYDVENREILPRMKPSFLLSRNTLDAQSGMTQSLAIYDQYLFGSAQDLGFFAYDLRDKKNPKSFLPVSEYHFKKINQYHPLFLIPKKEKTYQAIIPKFDLDEGKITFLPLLEKPLMIDPLVAKNVRNNRFQIFTDLSSPNNAKVAFDLEKQIAIQLPEKITSLPVGKVLEYLKKN